MANFAPPHDCRLTIRCLKACFGFRPERGASSFEPLRSENTLIDQFFERRRDDPQGGEGGERIGQVRSKPVFALHSGRMRAATWFDRTRPPQAIVWLLGAELHDERHKGARDAYDLFAAQEGSGDLFPKPVDYKLLELHRRLTDTATFADDVRRDAAALVSSAAASGGASGTLAGVPSRLIWQSDASGGVVLHVAVSLNPVTGARSGCDFPLTQERFLLLSEAVRQAAEDLYKPEVLAEETYGFPSGGLANERAFVLVFEP